MLPKAIVSVTNCALCSEANKLHLEWLKSKFQKKGRINLLAIKGLLVEKT